MFVLCRSTNLGLCGIFFPTMSGRICYEVLDTFIALNDSVCFVISLSVRIPLLSCVLLTHKPPF
jgi:hypothetical protein